MLFPCSHIVGVFDCDIHLSYSGEKKGKKEKKPAPEPMVGVFEIVSGSPNLLISY